MNELSYTPKELVFDQEGRDKLLSGIEKISEAVKSTLGPRGNTVLIESQNHTKGVTITKDGVTVAKSIALEDPVENLAVRIMKDAADRTAVSAGDGTTTAIVLTEAIIKAGMEHLSSGDVSVTEVIREINDMSDEIVKFIEKRSKKVSGRRLDDVATVSANNDAKTGKLIADAYKKVGENGIVTVERSQTSETFSEVTEGIRIDRGYTTHLFVNDHKRDECVLEDVHILCADQEIANVVSIERILKPVINDNKKLLIIGNCSQNVINTLAANVVRNGLKICHIIPPQFGYKSHELMNDIALAVGAKYFSESTGDDLGLISMDDLGFAEKVIVSRDDTIIIRGKGNNEDIDKRVEELWHQHNNAKRKADKDFLKERIASLTGGIGIIYVGGNSDVEQKELYDRVDDAVCAVRSALEEGIVPGGGISLYKSASILECDDSEKSKKIAYAIFTSALKAPAAQILNNAGKYLNDIYYNDIQIADWNYGYDVKAEKYGDMFKMGIIDPAKVTKNALRNAVSVATTILSTNAIVTLKRQ